MRYDRLKLNDGRYIAPPEPGGIEETRGAGPNPEVYGPLLGFTFVLPDDEDAKHDWFYFVPVSAVQMAMVRIGKRGSAARGGER